MKYSDECIFKGDRVITKAYAKVNLTLDVLSKRDDGYHELESVMQSVSLFDLIIIDKSDTIRVKTNLNHLPTNENNIAFKAAKLFFEKSGISGGASVLIHKNIPIGAGLGGGSSDGASTLIALNRLYGYPLTDDELFKLAAKVGADVPFCMLGSTALAGGIGEKLKKLSPCRGLNMLIVKPKVSISTPEIFKLIDSEPIKKHPNNEEMVAAIENGDIEKICANTLNVLRYATQRRCPQIGGIIAEMKKGGALCSEMTGSGSAVFGIFSSARDADECAKRFYSKYNDVYSVITV